MKWASGVLQGALVMAVAVSVLGSGCAMAGDKGDVSKAYEKALDRSVSALTKFTSQHPDSDEAEKARYMVASIYTRYASTDWLKKNLENAKAFLADLEAREHRMVRGMKGKVLDIELLAGKAPPAIEVTALDGKPLSLGDYEGKVLLIDFWATWCGPCIRELPNVKEVYAKYKDKGFDILGVSLDRDGAREKLEKFIQENEMPWRQIYDGKGWESEVGSLYGVSSIPKTYLLDKEGKVVEVGLRGEALGKTVAKYLEGEG